MENTFIIKGKKESLRKIDIFFSLKETIFTLTWEKKLF